MGKVIKKGDVELGDITPDTGFAETVRRAPVIERDVVAAKVDSQRIREKALVEAEQIREQATQEAEEIKKAAHDQGYAEGREQGQLELAEVIANISLRAHQIEQQAIPQLKELAIKIARKILGRELEFAPEAVVDIVKQALSEKARQRRDIYLRVNPADLQHIRDHKPELLEVLSRAKEIGIREDPAIARHGVVIETDAGIIDAQLETQLAVFERVLKEAL